MFQAETLTFTLNYLVEISTGIINTIFAHAQREFPRECCGLLGGRGILAQSVYELTNAAANPLTEYEAAPADLFAAGREMRLRGEDLNGIYHSHPQQSEPLPSPTDVRRAFYPNAIYLIVGLGGDAPVLRAFRIDERTRRWEKIALTVTD